MVCDPIELLGRVIDITDHSACDQDVARQLTQIKKCRQRKSDTFAWHEKALGQQFADHAIGFTPLKVGGDRRSDSAEHRLP